MNFEEFADLCSAILAENNGENIVIYNVENKVKATKRIVVCEQKDILQTKHLAKLFLEKISTTQKPLHTDGIYRGEWVVFDFEDVIVHVLTTENKNKYNFDKLYKDAECKRFSLQQSL